MKSILVPTDFSEVSKNAIEYAVQLAKLSGAKILLFHVSSIPVLPGEVPVLIPVDGIEKEVKNALKKIGESIRQQHGDKIKIEYETAFGFRPDEINLLAARKKVDLIVMGTQGAGYLSEKLFGNLSSVMMRKANCPVMVIDAGVKFKSIDRVVFAYNNEEIYHKSILQPLKKLVNLFGSYLYLLNVIPESKIVRPNNKVVSKIALNVILEGVNHSFHFKKNNNVVEGINQFVKQNKIDMIVMMPRMHISIKEIFKETNTKRMTFHTKIPLLAIHE